MSLKQFCTALHTLLIMTAEPMLSKRLILKFIVALLFLLREKLHVINHRVCCELSYLFLQLAISS